MTVKAVDMVAAVAETAGASGRAVKSLRALLANDGMVTTGDACRTLGVSTWTMRRLCRKHGIRRETRLGRGGSLLDLGALQAAMNNAKAEGVQNVNG